jgi:polyhydroxybutyrate depolymerase
VVALCGACTSHATHVSRSTSTTSTTQVVAAARCGAPHAAGQTAETFTFQGRPRTYQQYVPRLYDGRTNVPVVFDFHGYGSSAAQQMVYGDFRPLADRDTFLIVAPDGQGASRHFNLAGEPGLQDDVAMVNALLDHIEATFCVDVNRVYATGMSDGGAMSSTLACKEAERFAAFGPVAVMFYLPGCAGQRDVSIVSFMGTADPVVPFNGGRISCCGQANIGAAPDTMARWAAHDGCNAAVTEDRLSSEVRRRTWTGCAGRSGVVFYIIDGGGHTWPGSIALPRLGLTTNQINASATIWDFFLAHPSIG